MCGGVRSIAARSDEVVSPVRTAAVMRGASMPVSSASTPNADARFGEVLVDVGAQRLQRRDVDDAHFIRKRSGEPFLQQIVERREKRRERFARAGRRGDERVATLGDGRPALRLGGGRFTERFAEPTFCYGMKTNMGHRAAGRRLYRSSMHRLQR